MMPNKDLIGFVVTESQLPNGTVSASSSKFDAKIEASSAKMYFHYYGQLLHQQNMLQDYVRTGDIAIPLSAVFHVAGSFQMYPIILFLISDDESLFILKECV